MGPTAPLLELKGVQQRYFNNGKTFTAISHMDLTIQEGEFVAIVGPSGCGKSTLVRIICGLQTPTEGEILYRKKQLVGVNPHSTIVFQTFALFPWLTVQQNVEVALESKGMAKDLRALRAIELLDRVGLDGFETAYPRELSGGMRQKVGFARAMAVEPELLCLDEPFSALDILSAESLRGELLELWLSGRIPTKAILMITHNIEEAILMADRILIMNKNPGRVIAETRVPMSYPRHRKDANFIKHIDRIYALLAGKTLSIEAELFAFEKDQSKALPSITVGELTGLMEHLHEGSKASDIYQLEKDLKISTDQLLALVEAAGILQFVAISEGHVTLTPLGETFVEAKIQVRKEIFAKRIRRLPLFGWLLDALEKSDIHALEWEETKSILEVEFSPKVAEEQLDILISWGRYAEILTYNDKDGLIHLET